MTSRRLSPPWSGYWKAKGRTLDFHIALELLPRAIATCGNYEFSTMADRTASFMPSTRGELQSCSLEATRPGETAGMRSSCQKQTGSMTLTLLA